MKKILLILALALGVEVNAQIVGGFLPLRSTKTPTMGSAVITGSTIVLGTKTLTSGNTGTVAVLSDALFNISFNVTGSGLNDGATVYFGNAPYLFSTNATNGTVTIPYNCTLVGWDFNEVLAGTIGTSESSTLSIAGSTTNYTLSTGITFSAAGSYQGFSGSGLSQNFVAGERINGKLIAPTFATNPTAIYAGLTLWFVRRS